MHQTQHVVVLPPGAQLGLSLAKGHRPAMVKVKQKGLANGLRPAMVRVHRREKEKKMMPSLAIGHRPAMVLPHKVQRTTVLLTGLVKINEDG